MAKRLRAAGHDVHVPTLSGLGERSHLAQLPITLSTHINDIVNEMVWHDLSDVVLVAHSYGGFVATGVAERALESASPRSSISMPSFLKMASPSKTL